VWSERLKTGQDDSVRARLLLDIADALVMKQGEDTADLDPAIAYAQQARASSRRFRYHYLEGRSDVVLSKGLRERKYIDSGALAIQRALTIFKQGGNHRDLGLAYLEAAQFPSLVTAEEIELKKMYYQEAVKYFILAKDKENEAFARKMLGDCYSMQDNFSDAMAELLHSLEIYKSIHFKKLQSIYDLIGSVYSATGDFQKALEYLQLAEKTSLEVGDSTQQLEAIYNHLGIAAYNLNEWEKSIPVFYKALDLAKKFKDTLGIQFIYPNICYSLMNLNRDRETLLVLDTLERNYLPVIPERIGQIYICRVSCYVRINDHKAAVPYVRKIEQMMKEHPEEKAMVSHMCSVMVRYYFLSKNYRMTIYYCQQAERLYKEYGLRMDERLYGYWYRSDSSLGNYVAAIEHLANHKLVNDSLRDEKKNKEIARLSVQYETEQKDKDIKLLTREGTIQKAALNHAQFVRNVIVGGAAMLVMLLLLLYNRYQLKQKTNRSLQALIVEKEWLVKEIHHRVKNNLQIVMSLLNTQAAYLQDKDALRAISESRLRMQAISLIHQKLYQTEDMAMIEMSGYIPELVSYLQDPSPGIRFELAVDKVSLDVSQSVPVGLILNEAITNAVKYAFPGGRGTVKVSLLYNKDGLLELAVRDNGVGLPEGFDMTRHASMGMMLMETLSEQLEGRIIIKNDAGTSVTVIFKRQDTVPEPLQKIA
jgi:two-component sensor histidine kinase